VQGFPGAPGVSGGGSGGAPGLYSSTRDTGIDERIVVATVYPEMTPVQSVSVPAGNYLVCWTGFFELNGRWPLGTYSDTAGAVAAQGSMVLTSTSTAPNAYPAQLGWWNATGPAGWNVPLSIQIPVTIQAYASGVEPFVLETKACLMMRGADFWIFPASLVAIPLGPIYNADGTVVMPPPASALATSG
jgi:hypothetical protein